jgi:imidazolonepropionase-like amidohydrolase
MGDDNMKPFWAAAAIFSITTSAVAQDEPPLTLFTNINLYNGVSPELIMDAHVLVEGNLIAAVSSEPIKAEGATVIDGGGRTLTPGLIDAHTHLQAVEPLSKLEFFSAQELGVRMAPVAEDMLMRGFTTVRDLCGNTHGLRRAINAGHVPGPRIVSAGACISGWSGHGDFFPDTAIKGQTHSEGIGVSIIADGPDEIRVAIRRELRNGASFIKLMIGGGLSSSFDPLDVTTMSKEEIEAAVDEVSRWNTYATAHIYTDFGLNMAMDAGMRTFEHMHLASRETFERMKELDMVVCTQLAVIDGLGSNPNFVTPAQQKKAQFMEDNASAAFKLIAELDIPTCFGVDSFANFEGFRFNSQAITSRKSFFDNETILEQIFQNNRRILEMSNQRLPYLDGPLGVIEAGAYADILLVEGDPTEDVAVFSDWENKIDFVMKDGTIYKNALN